MLLVWAGYGVGLWGWCLVRDYDVTLGQLFSPTHPYSGAWPPAAIPSGQTWPGAPAASSGTAASTSTAPAASNSTSGGVGSGLSG